MTSEDKKALIKYLTDNKEGLSKSLGRTDEEIDAFITELGNELILEFHYQRNEK